MKTENIKYKDSGIPWIGEIPSAWKMCRVKNYCSLHGRIGWNGLRSDEFEEDSYAYLVTGQDFNAAEINWHKCYQIRKERYDEDEFIQLKDGDILVTKDGTIGKIAVVTRMDKPACLNSGIFVMRQLQCKWNPKFLYWFLASPLLILFNNYINLGGTTIIHLYQNVFERMPMLIPPLPTQQRIADFLDKKCSEIDELAALQETMIAELKRYKQSVITEAVTKGLDKNVKMKDSGVEWIGEIPEGWEVRQIKRYAKVNNGKEIIVELPANTPNAKPVYGSGGIFKYTNDILFNGEAVLFGRKGTLGKPLYVNGEFWVVDTMYYLTFDSALFPKYAYYELMAFDWIPFITHTAIPSVVASDVVASNVPIPPLTEQRAIADYLDRKCAEIDELIAIKQQKIEQLKEYKKSVIFEYVTGKKEVAK